eukprot:GHVR01009017.1.p1 GENE.GHVR01009017.1~~GHVR01009017.1.p1  ORF type:complete len:578 (-),score=139.93 GHVR01009017.1:25-1704(-)
MFGGGRGPQVLVLKQNAKREQGRKAQMANITAAKTVADIVRTTLGPLSMLKMLLDPMGGIVITNDGNAILREVDVNHPAAKCVIELARAQDEEVGDGTTSVVVLAGELMGGMERILTQHIHPTVAVSGLMEALDYSICVLNKSSTHVDFNNDQLILDIVNASIHTKFSSQWGPLISKMAVDAVKCVRVELPNGKFDIDTKRYAKVEKIPGGDVTDCRVIDGVMVNKDITHPSMSRRIVNPKVLLLDCTLEYKKGESATQIEVTSEDMWKKLLEEEEEEIKSICSYIIGSGCNVVVTEKGVADLAQHYLHKAGISVIRRVRKMDNNRIARVTGATIVNRCDEIEKDDVGSNCKLFSVEKIGDEYYTYFTGSTTPYACTLLLRGASKDVLSEVERNLTDGLCVARNILLGGGVLPGGGAIEMELAGRLNDKANGVDGVRQHSYRALAAALEVIPRTLTENCGADVVRTLTELRARHAEASVGLSMGVDGLTGRVCDVTSISVWDTHAVKVQILKTAVESCCMLLRIDDVLSGLTSKNSQQQQQESAPTADEDHTFGDSRDG